MYIGIDQGNIGAYAELKCMFDAIRPRAVPSVNIAELLRHDVRIENDQTYKSIEPVALGREIAS